MNRVCAGLPGAPCSRVTDKRRCPACARKYEVMRGPRRVKGAYDAEWRKVQAQAIREQPWCSRCRTGGTPDNPLTGDHITPRAAGGRNVRANVQVLCRDCNSRKGARFVSGATPE